MALFEIKVEIPAAAAEAADTTLLEHGLENWSVLEDVIVKRAWLVGIFADEPEATKAWSVVTPLLAEAGVVLVGEPVRRAMGDADWRDSYKSLSEALIHGGVANDVKVTMQYVDSEELEKGKGQDLLAAVDGILVPGGFGERGIEGKILAVKYARTEGVPYFGICLGMQLAVIEYARHVAGIPGATSAEFKPDGKANVVDLMESQKGVKDLGGTMRLGAYPCQVMPKYGGKPTKAFAAYGKEAISERHRHRFEVSNQFRAQIEEKGLLVSGRNVNKESGVDLVEMVEIPGHPWFLGCQFHPEFLSKPLSPHPLFSAFIKAAKETGKGGQPSLGLKGAN
jgi:CTP synthase